MSEQPAERDPGKRGEAAWKEYTAGVAERNRLACARGKQQREAHERAQAELRRAEERRGVAELLRRHPAR